jgi:hypothetical protein
MNEKNPATCNCCGSFEWTDMGIRKNIRCKHCGSLERTRVLKLQLDSYNLPLKGMKILHLAPEKGIYDFFKSIDGIEYNPVDLNPSNFKFGEVTKFDCCTDTEKLPSNYYDIIIHSHVMEHIPCNISAVLINLHRALKKDGFHFMCIPINGGFFAEDYSDLSEDERTFRFGQSDHIRRFGRNDITRTLGMIFYLPKYYDIEMKFPKYLLNSLNIPEKDRKGFTGSSVFVLKKSDLKIKSE